MWLLEWIFCFLFFVFIYFFCFLVFGLILKGTHLDEIVFVCAMLTEMWDLGGLTLYVLVVWLQRKWRKRGEIGILGCYRFSLIWFLKGNWNLYSTMLTSCSEVNGYYNLRTLICFVFTFSQQPNRVRAAMYYRLKRKRRLREEWLFRFRNLQIYLSLVSHVYNKWHFHPLKLTPSNEKGNALQFMKLVGNVFNLNLKGQCAKHWIGWGGKVS